jgi:WD40 repeat protein
MQHTRWLRSLVFCVSLCLCGSLFPLRAADPTKKGAKITYDEHVLPILKDKCVGCHNQDKKRAGLVLNNYTKVMEGGSSGVAVKVGDPDNSLLYKVINHASEPFMPPKSPKLAKDSLDVIHKWIVGGAPENAGSKVIIPDRPKVDFTLPSVVKGKPSGPPPMPPRTMRLDPIVRAARDTAVTSLASSPWAPLVAVGGQKQVLLYHSDTLDLLGVLPFPEGTPNVLRFSRNGSLLIAGGGRAGKSGLVVVWSVTKGERLTTVGEESDSVLAADISPDQTQVALGGPGKVVRIYSTRDGKLQHEIRKHTDWVTAMEFSPDGVLLATGDRNGGLFVWESFTAREYFTLRGHSAAISEISWRTDSNVVASGSEDATVRLYEMENGNQIRSWGAHGGGVQSVRYGGDGKIVSAGRDRLARLWDGNGTAQRAFEAFPDVALRSIMTHDSARVIAADWTGQIVVWNAADGKRIGTLSANPPTVAEQLVLAQKTLAERQKAAEVLTTTAKASQATLVKLTADLTVAQKAIGDTAAAVKTAEQKLTQAKAAIATAQAAVKTSAAEVKAKETLSQALAEAATKVKAEADKAKDNTALAAASTRAQALAGQVTAELTLARKTLADMTAAVKAVEPSLVPAQQALTAAQAAALAAPKNLVALQAALKAAQPKGAADKTAADQAAAELAQAQASVARWQAAASLVKKTM